MRPDRSFVAEHADKIRGLGEFVAGIVPTGSSVDRFHQIDWKIIADVREKVRDRYGHALSIRINQAGNHVRARSQPGIGLSGFPDYGSDVVVPLWQTCLGNVTQYHLERLCWIYDQAMNMRDYVYSDSEVRGRIYITTVGKKLLDMAVGLSELPMRCLLERDKPTPSTYDFQVGNRIEGMANGRTLVTLTMKENLVKATMLRSDTLSNRHHFDYKGNVLEFSCALPVSVLQGLKDLLLEEVIDMDVFKGSGIRITSARYVKDQEPEGKIPGLARLGLRDLGNVVLLEEDPEHLAKAA